MSEVEENAFEQAAAFVAKFMEVFLTPVILLLTTVALLVFIYGALSYVANADNEQAREDGRRHMIYGIIGLFVMVSAYAILWIFANTFGLEGELEKIHEATQPD